MSWLLLAFWTMSFSPSAAAAACVSLVSDSEAGFFGLTRSPITAAFGASSCSNSSRLGASVLYRKVVPVTLPPGRLRLETRPSLTASPPIENTIGMVAVAGFGGKWRRRALDRNDHGHPAANQVGRQCWQSVEATLRPAVFDRDVAALDIAGFVEASPDARQVGWLHGPCR